MIRWKNMQKSLHSKLVERRFFRLYFNEYSIVKTCNEQRSKRRKQYSQEWTKEKVQILDLLHF